MTIPSSPGTPVQQLVIAGTDQLVIPGTTQFVLTDYSIYENPINTGTFILGQPRILPSAIIPDGFTAYFLKRVTLQSPTQLSIKGSGQLIVSDDFGTRSRIQLVGSNT